MKTKCNVTVFTLWMTRLIGLLLFILLFAMPSLLDWYCNFRYLQEVERIAILSAFYICAVFVFSALWHLHGLLKNILAEQVFIRENVRHIRFIQWCCGIVGLVCAPAAACYYPLVFLVIIMGFLCLVVSVLTRVMDVAVSIREENDLTV